MKPSRDKDQKETELEMAVRDIENLNFAEMTEDERYRAMDVEKPKLTIAQWFAREKILAHRAAPMPWGIGHVSEDDETQELICSQATPRGEIYFRSDAQWILNNTKTHSQALRLIEFLEEKLATILDNSGNDFIFDQVKEVLTIDMETF